VQDASGEENWGALPPLSLRKTNSYAPGFLSTGATGLLAASQFAFSPLALANQDKKRAKTTAEPNPIPGGGTAFGFHVHHNPLPNDPGLPLNIFNTAQGDPSEIGDFNGLVVDTMIRGLGTGSGVTFEDDNKPGSLAFRADMGAHAGRVRWRRL
jgi:hypothetical protein